VFKRKYVVLLLLTLVSIPITALFYSNLAQAQSTVTGYVSVSAAAFVPCNVSLSSYNFWGKAIYNYESTTQDFVGPVQLPSGSTVKNLTVFWYDSGEYTVGCTMCRQEQSSVQFMASVGSSGFGHGFSYDDTIDWATIDNSLYTYYLWMWIPPGSYNFKYAIIEYTLPSQAVGGFWIPVDKFSLLAPYFALVATIILAVSLSVAIIKHRKKQ